MYNNDCIISLKCPFCDETNRIDTNTKPEFCQCSTCHASFGIREALRHS